MHQSLNTINKNFVSKWLSQFSIELDNPLKMQKIPFFGEFNKNINFSTKFQYWINWKTNNLYDLLFLVAINSPKNDSKHEMKW